MTKLIFKIKCNPPKSTAQASNKILKTKDGRLFVGKAKNSKGEATRNEIMALLMPYRPKEPLTGALHVAIDWRYPFRKTETKKNREKGVIHCTTRPDADNLCKFMLDCMTRLGFWGDDSQIAHLEFRKVWVESHEMGIEVGVRTLE